MLGRVFRWCPSVVVGLLALVAAPATACADLQVATAAYDRGEYGAALQELQRIVDADGPEAADAHAWLGLLHEMGNGVVADWYAAGVWYVLAAEQGSRMGQYRSGLAFERGIGVAVSFAAARRWYQAAADQGDPEARVAAERVAHGADLEERVADAERAYQEYYDFESARQQLVALAHDGSARAEYWIGRLLLNGDGVARDEAAAAGWFRTAAERGDAEAQAHLGDLYRDGLGVARDPSTAVGWYRAAAASGLGWAATRLGDLYIAGDGVDRSTPDAARWYQKAAILGEPRAQVALAKLYLDGRGVPRSAEEAAHLYRAALRRADGEAAYRLGQLYERGAGVPKDHDQAIHFLELAAEQGWVAAAAAAARLGRPSAARIAYDAALAAWSDQDFEAVRRVLVPLAAEGHGGALHLLGMMYGFGGPYGVVEDDAKAFDLYRRASEAGDAAAQYILAHAYDRGAGAARDKAEALRWYGAAAAQGEARAQRRLAMMLEAGDGTPADLEAAKVWYRRAAYQADATSLWALRRLDAETVSGGNGDGTAAQ